MIPLLEKARQMELTASEQLLLDYIIEDPKRCIHQNLKEICEQLYISNATIVRFCQKIGFCGFNEFKFELRSQLESHREDLLPGDAIFDAQLSMFKDYIRSVPFDQLEQIYQIQKDTGERVSNIVVMGSGEPMDNYDNLIRFIRLITSKEGLNISQRNITVSTCGIVPGIKKLANEGLALTLALSLHAPDDETRKKLMPIANVYPLSQVIDACHEYFQKTGRRLTFEYSLVKGVNDNLNEAKALTELIRDQHGHVNLIPVNPIKERDYVQSGKKAVEAFRDYLEKHGIQVTIRREMGRDINGACGQLRKSYMESEGEVKA